MWVQYHPYPPNLAPCDLSCFLNWKFIRAEDVEDIKRKKKSKTNPHSTEANLLNCDIIVSNFKLQSFSYVHFGSNHHHHHHVMLLAWISLTLSRHFFLSFIASGWSSGLHPVSSHSCCMYVRAGHPAFAWPYAGVHTSTSLMSSSLFSSSVLHVWFV